MKVGYRLSPNEELQLLQAERERRRKLRLVQVHNTHAFFMGGMPGFPLGLAIMMMQPLANLANNWLNQICGFQPFWLNRLTFLFVDK